MSGRMKVNISHSTCWAGKALLRKLPSSAKRQPPARLLSQAEISWGWLVAGEAPRCLLPAFSPPPVSTSLGAAVPNQVAAAHLRFLPFPPFLTQARLEATLGFFSARGLNLLSPSWEHSMPAAIAGWPG